MRDPCIQSNRCRYTTAKKAGLRGNSERVMRLSLPCKSCGALTDQVNARESYNSGRPLAFGKNFRGTEIRTKTGDSIAQTGKERKEQRQTYMYKQSAFL